MTTDEIESTLPTVASKIRWMADNPDHAAHILRMFAFLWSSAYAYMDESPEMQARLNHLLNRFLSCKLSWLNPHAALFEGFRDPRTSPWAPPIPAGDRPWPPTGGDLDPIIPPEHQVPSGERIPGGIWVDHGPGDAVGNTRRQYSG